jgi:fibro-slime domain-containing protein/pilin isopeptide linkage protein
MKSRLVKHLCSGAIAATVLFQIMGRTGITTYAEMGEDQQVAEAIDENGENGTESDNNDDDIASNDEQGIDNLGDDNNGNEEGNDENNDTGDGGIDEGETDDADISESEDDTDVEDELDTEETDDEENVTDPSEDDAEESEADTITIFYMAGEGGTLENLPAGETVLTEVVILPEDEELATDEQEDEESLSGDDTQEDEVQPEESVDEDVDIVGATAASLEDYEFVNWTLELDDSIVSTSETLLPSIEDLKALPEGTEQVTFVANFEEAESEYKAAEFIPTVHMSLTGKELESGEFEFLMVATDIDGNEVAGGYSKKAYNDASGNVEFPVISYDEPGTYYYRITQINDGKAGVTYDSTYYSLRVYVSKDSEDETVLKANAAYFKNSNAVPISVRMYDYDETPINDGHSLKFSDGGNKKFKPFNYYVGKQKGVYQGIVATTLGEDGYPYLNSSTTSSSESLSYLFNANTNGVVSSNENAVLYHADGNGTYLYSSNSFYPFGAKDYLFGVMTQTAFTIPEDGIANGKDMTYTFSGDDDVWVYVDGKLVIDLGGIHDAYGAQVNFNTGAITYFNPQAGGAAPSNSYISNLSEVFPGGWKDGKIHEIKIFYFERGKYLSNYTSVFNFDLVAIFANTYVEAQKEIVPVKTTITGDKKLTGRDLAEGEFTFLLYETGSDFVVSDTDTPLYTAVNKADGSFAFDEIEYKEAGDHYYVVKEQIPEGAVLNEDGSYTYNDVTYDASQINVTVTVTANTDGELSLQMTTSSAVAFTNTYKTPDVPVTPPSDPPVTPEDPQTPSTPSTPSETPSQTPTQVGAPPIAMTDEGTEVEEPEVLGETRLAVTDESSVLGESRNHNTGDDFNITKNIIIILAASAAISLLVFVSKKRRAN